MSWRGLRPSILAIAAALGSAAAGSAYAQEPPRASGAPTLLLAQNNEEAEEQRRKRREERQERREKRQEAQGEGQQQRQRGNQSGQQADEQQPRRERAEQRRERQEAQGEGQQQRRRGDQAEPEARPSRGEARKERTEQKATGNNREEPRRRRGDADGGDAPRGDRAAQRNNAPQDAEEDARKGRRERGEERRDDRRERADDRKNERRERADDRRQDRGQRAQQRGERRELTREERRERRRDRQEFTRERLKDITRERRRTEEGGRVVIEEPGKRRIIREGGRTIIEHDDNERLRGSARNVEVERGPKGRTRTIITRPNGVQIINVEARNGRLVRRIKRLPNGREIVLINNEFEGRRGRRFRDDDRTTGIDILVDLPDLILERSARRGYYANTDDSDEEELYEALSAPPVQELEDDYSLDEIRYSPDIRKRLRRINLNNVTFASGSWEVPEAQIDRLATVAKVINRIIENDPDQVILVSGYTDAVGSDEDNLSLSDRRAETVARILTDEFGVPPENLVTQGYGESDLLIETAGDEPRNRRVEFMRITPFLAQK